MKKFTNIIFPFQYSNEYILLGILLLAQGIFYGIAGYFNFLFFLHMLNIVAIIGLISLNTQKKIYQKYYRWITVSVLIVLLTATTVISAEFLGMDIWGNNSRRNESPTEFVPLIIHMSFLLYALIAQIASVVLLCGAFFGKTTYHIIWKASSIKLLYWGIGAFLVIIFAFTIGKLDPLLLMNTTFAFIPILSRSKLLS